MNLDFQIYKPLSTIQTNFVIQTDSGIYSPENSYSNVFKKNPILGAINS
ncbi:42544_t:CDS:1 [Gigaspora margarita]|uniref:42544_t:CDS:1 n=1 Tax=Gigaspora margarita TaxID=4874 RepID=A0ABN7WXY1_GIGMA|nr:42544_t:CDS:1 [Gigaspora margarita]